MSGPASRNLKQDITYWAPSGSANDFNELPFADPVVVKGRWTDQETVVRHPNGDETIFRNLVYLLQDVEEKGYLGLGDQSGTADPKQADAFEIHSFYATPDLRNMEQQHRAIC